MHLPSKILLFSLDFEITNHYFIMKEAYKALHLIQSTLKTATLSIFAISILAGCDLNKKNELPDNTKIVVKGTMKAELTSPPMVPAPVGDRPAMKLLVDLEVVEQVQELADGVRYTLWTFGGTVPGSFIRARIGDEIEFTLANHPTSSMPHNIDLHAATGPGGGASSSLVVPGHKATFSFKLLNPGLYVYHCATAPVGMHIANGMYGLILVEPEGGLPKVDREYYVMQGDFYLKNFDKRTEQVSQIDMEKVIAENADYVLFNGRVGSLTEERALKANVGETVRIFVGNGGPNLASSFHIIGEILDTVHAEGGSVINHNVQTTTIAPGSATTVELKVETAGTFLLVDHAITRAFNKGALAMLTVGGEPNLAVYSGQKTEGVYTPEGQNVQSLPVVAQTGPAPEITLAEKIDQGKKIYERTCVACHQANGAGIASAFPPLANSDFLNADTARAIDAVKNGLSGLIKVNGVEYNSVMPAQGLSDAETASVLTYVYSQWGNKKQEVKVTDVQKVMKHVEH